MAGAKTRIQVNPGQILSQSGEKLGIQTKPLTGEQKAGLGLSYTLLIIVSVVLLVFFSFFYLKELDSSENVAKILSNTNVNDANFAKRIEQAKQIASEKKEYREFLMKNFQYVIGVLLPILTSILGYIFGTRAKD